MNPDVFFKNFELLADSPNGVQKLRELILQLAVRGKLVPQDPNDEPTSVLLEKIKAEKKKLSEESNLKNDSLPLIKDGELTFKIPQSWKWVRLGEVINYNGAQKVSSEDIPDDAWLLDLEDIEKNTSKILNHVYFKDRKSKSTKAKFNRGDVLYGKLRPYLNKVVVAEDNGYCTTEIVPLSIYTGIDPYYLMYSLKRPDFLEYVNSKTYGTKMPRLGTEDGKKSLFPLPPLAEQKRIVSKVDELMTLCEKLEARRQIKQEIQSKLNSAALDRMLSAENQEEFEQSWQRICENFDLLYDNPENIEKLKQVILQLAIQGKLLEHNPEDEPAEILLEKIRGEKERLVKGGIIKNFKPLPPIEENETPYELPKEWQWVRLEDLVSLLGDGLHGTPEYSDLGDYFFINGNNLSDGKIIIKNYTKRVSIDEYNKYKKELNERTVLVSINGTLGNVAFYNNERVILGKSACYFNLLHEINKYYLKLLINTSYFLEYAFKNATGTTIKNVSLKSMRLFLVPLPPLAEQKRIVEKVDRLMGLCDELELKLRREREDSEKLMETVIRGVLEGTVA